MTERQLYRIFHVLDTVVRARPELQLCIALDYRQWFPRDEDGCSIAGFSDPDTLASITPQQLLTLSLGPTTPLGPSALGSMVAGCYQLAALTIERWCDDEALAIVARGLPNLLSLTIKQATKLTDAALLFASPLLTNLNLLDLCECPQLTDRGLTAMIRGSAAQLENIRVSFCERMTDLTMTQISASCGRNLLLLDVSGNPLITAQGVILLFPEHCKLQELHVNFVSGAIDADVLEAILENGWTVQKISAAFTHLDVGYDAAQLIQKLRSRGTDVMC